jgi:hemolysin activation/secretion protein
MVLSSACLFCVISSDRAIAQVTTTPATNLGQLPALPPPQDVIPLPPAPEPVQPTPTLPPPDQLLPPPTTIPEPSRLEDVPQTIVVERFNVTGSTIFSAAELEKVTAPFTQRPLSLAELFQVRSAITQRYLDAGYITSGAFIPPQKLEAGVVEIRVVEGGLEAIRVTGTRRLNPNYVRSRLAIATNPPLKRDRLLEALQLLQLNPLIKNLTAELSAGTRPGQSLLEVKVTEANTFSGQITLDNGRSPSVGTFRRQVQLSEANLLGLGDGLSLAYSNTDGSNAFDASYALPINPRNGTIGLNTGFSFSKVIEKPFDELDIDSRSVYYDLFFRQPILQSPTRELALGLTASHRVSKATLLDGDIPFPSPGADDDGQTKITALRFFQEWTQRNQRSVFAARSQFSVGLDALGSTINESPDSRFYTWRGQVQWVRLLATDTLLLVRGDLQLADRPLPTLEQFGLGGQQSVRGYRQDALLTDSGIFASAEVRVPVLRLPQASGILHLTPFVEVGNAWNRGDRPDPDPKTLVSVGLGLRLQLGNSLTARVDYGIPLVSIDTDKKTLQERGVYFSLIYNPF